MTEDEARKKTCPVGKMRGSFDGNLDQGPCIGSACMAWRWGRAVADGVNQAGEQIMRVNGFCGLAGRPEF